MREPADADVARVSKIARATTTGLRAELMRSISYYRAQQQGKRGFIIRSSVFWKARIVRHTSLNSLRFLLQWTKGITRRIDAFQ
jgi:hypothetical protein